MERAVGRDAIGREAAFISVGWGSGVLKKDTGWDTFV
jgi:hypothetical protein